MSRFTIDRANNGWTLNIEQSGSHSFMPPEIGDLMKLAKKSLSGNDSELEELMQKSQPEAKPHGLFIFPTWDELSGFIKYNFTDGKN